MRYKNTYCIISFPILKRMHLYGLGQQMPPGDVDKLIKIIVKTRNPVAKLFAFRHIIFEINFRNFIDFHKKISMENQYVSQDLSEFLWHFPISSALQIEPNFPTIFRFRGNSQFRLQWSLQDIFGGKPTSLKGYTSPPAVCPGGGKPLDVCEVSCLKTNLKRNQFFKNINNFLSRDNHFF